MNKKRWMFGLLAGAMALTGCASSKSASSVDLNSMTLAQITEKAKAEGQLATVGMPDTWANWGETWKEYTAKYGIKHADTDMSSAEELSLFSSEKSNATKDMGDVGQAFGPIAKQEGLSMAYKTSYWNSIPSWAKDKDGHWIIGYYGTLAIMTNKKLVKNPPKSFADILKGNYKVSVGDVSAANQAQFAVLAAAIANGGSESNIKPGLDYFKKIAQQGRLDKGEFSLSRIEKGEIQVALIWDYNALGYQKQILANNKNASFDITIPKEGSIQSGYCTIINKYTKHPYAAALARNYILSDEGQINLAKGYARPVRNVTLPASVKKALLPDNLYKNSRMVKDQSAWDKTTKSIGSQWKEQVLTYAK